MCGIAGIFTFGESRPVDWFKDRLNPIVDAQQHRGPDASGIWISPDGQAALGHRRLSIIDLDVHSNQPFADSSGRYQIAFNGEIYNYRELRSELEAHGKNFRTNSDTEVLIEAYAHWGKSCLERFDGMYAFAIYDSHEHTLFAARDPFGEKPFYYAETLDYIAFASELKPLTSLPEMDCQIEESSIAGYLSFQYIGNEASIFRGAKKLLPGHWLSIDAQRRIARDRHFTFQPSEEKRQEPLDTLADELEELLVISLQRRMRADVPVGVFLSGGLDSSIVAALTSKRLGLHLDSFSLGFRGSLSSEHGQASDTAAHLGLRHHELLLEKTDTLDVETIGRIVDEPNGDTSLLPTWHLCRLARQHVKVALSGDGSDELFGGYGRYTHTLATANSEPAGSQYYSNRILVFAENEIQTYLKGAPPGYARQILDARRTIDSTNASLIDRLRKTDVERYMPGAVLAKVDRMSMQHGLEVRTPFLNREVARFAESLGTDALISDGVGKKVLRRVAERYLPYDTVYRPKSGFGLPLEQWGKEKLSEAWTQVCSRSQAHVRWWLPEPQRTFGAVNTYQTWALLVLGIYLENNRYTPDSHNYGPKQLNALRKLRNKSEPVTGLTLHNPETLYPFLPDGSKVITPSGDPNDPRNIQLDWLQNQASIDNSTSSAPQRILLLEEKFPVECAAHVAGNREVLTLPTYASAEAAKLRKRQSSPNLLFFDSDQNDRLPFTARSALADLRKLFSPPHPATEVEKFTALLRNDNTLFSSQTPKRTLQLLRELLAFRRILKREKDTLNKLALYEANSSPVDKRVILLTSSLSSGGAERQLVLLAIQLKQAAFDVEVWLLDPLEGTRAHYLPLLRDAGISTSSLDELGDDLSLAVPATEVSDRALELICSLNPFLVEKAWNATRMLLQRKPAVLHSFLDSPNIVSGWSGILAGVPRIILSFRNANPSNFGLYEPWHKRHYKGLIKKTQIVLSGNSRYGNDDYAAWLGIPKSAVHLTPNGVDTQRFCPSPGARESIHRRHAIPANAKIVFSAFRFSKEKDPGTYFKTIERVAKAIPDVYFMLAGEGPLRGFIEGQIAKVDFQNRFLLIGRIEDPETYYAAADLTLLCSTHEGMPNVLLEAQSCGCPVVCTDSGGSREVVNNGESGDVFPIGDATSLSRQVIDLLENEELLKSRKSRCRPWIEEHFSLAAALRASTTLYNLNVPATFNKESDTNL